MAVMGIPDDDDLYRIMELYNPWWSGRQIQDGRVREFRRPGYAEMMRRMGEHPVHAVLGARQVGKTTMLYQAVAHLVATNDPRRVMFLSLDDLGMLPSADNLRRMLDLYALRTLGESMHRLARETYVVLDEAQAVSNWQQVLKSVVDRRGPITFIAAVSTSADIFGRSESLAGRVRHQAMEPMGFCESLAFGGHEHAAVAAEAGKGLRGALARSVEEGDPGAFYDRARDAVLELAHAQDGLRIHLSEYMLYGGCPGAAAGRDPVHRAEELRRAVRLSMYGDVVKVGGIRSPRAVEDLLYMLAQGSPRLINKDRLEGALGINKATLDAYLRLLEATYLVSYSRVYALSASGGIRTQRKAYVNDAGVRNAVLSMNDARLLSDPAEVGMIAETVACSHTRRLWRSLDPAPMSHMPNYWRSGRGDGVGLVMSIHRKPVPIEVKYRQRVDASDLKGLSRFVDRFKPGLALALVQDRVRRIDDATVAIPLWLYLAMCG